MAFIIMNLSEAKQEVIVKFAKALVETRGCCCEAEEATWRETVNVECDSCPFHCVQIMNGTDNKEALEKAKRYLLDLEVRELIEG